MPRLVRASEYRRFRGRSLRGPRRRLRLMWHVAASVAATARTIDGLVDDVLARDPAGAELAGKAMSLDPADLKLLINGVHYTEKPYLIVSIKSSQERSDWGEIPERKSSFGTIMGAVVGNDQTKAKFALNSFEGLANLSSDLIASDAARLVQRVNDLVAADFKSAATAGEKKQFPDFHESVLYDAV